MKVWHNKHVEKADIGLLKAFRSNLRQIPY